MEKDYCTYRWYYFSVLLGYLPGGGGGGGGGGGWGGDPGFLERGVHMYKDVGFALLILFHFSLNVP